MGFCVGTRRTRRARVRATDARLPLLARTALVILVVRVLPWATVDASIPCLGAVPAYPALGVVAVGTTVGTRVRILALLAVIARNSLGVQKSSAGAERTTNRTLQDVELPFRTGKTRG